MIPKPADTIPPRVDTISVETMQARHWVGFFALCLLWSSAWLVESAWPSSLPVDARQCTAKFAIAIVLSGCVIALRIARKKPGSRLSGLPWAKLALASIALLAVPALLLEATSGVVTQPMSECLFALVPVAVVVLAPYVGLAGPSDADALHSESWRETSHLLLPALVGLAGALLLLSFSLPGSLREAGFDSIVMAGVAAVAVASISMYRLLGGFSLLEASVVYCAANALVFAAFLAVATIWGGGMGWAEDLGGKAVATELAKAIFFELPQVLLLLWLLRAVPPARFAARYLVVPLMLSFESISVVRPTLTVRLVCGIVLIAAGVWRLLTAQVPKGETFLMLP